MITIAGMTLREALRKKLLAVAFILALIYLGLYGTGLHYAAKDIAGGGVGSVYMDAVIKAQLTTIGLYLASFLMAFLAIFSAIGAISSEIENGVVYALLPRPIRRAEVIMGKFLGYSTVVVVFGFFVFMSIVLLNKYILGFTLSGIPLGFSLFVLQALLLLAVSLLGTTFLPTLGNGIAVFMLYSIAVIGGFIEQIGAMGGIQKAIDVGIFTSLIMPSDAVYHKMIYILLPPKVNLFPQAMGPFGSSSVPSDAMMVYAVAHLAAVLIGAMYVFSRRDI